MPARPTPPILLLLTACATGNGPDTADAATSASAPASASMDCAAFQREMSAMPDMAAMQGAGMAAGIGTSLLSMVPIAGGIAAGIIGQAAAMTRQQAMMQFVQQRQEAARIFMERCTDREMGRDLAAAPAPMQDSEKLAPTRLLQPSR